jgi:hypothetical protein
MSNISFTIRLSGWAEVICALLASAGMVMQAQELKVPAPRQHRPISVLRVHDDGTYDSTNWAGYAVTGTNATSVSASWTVPAANCERGAQYSSFWVGIDGWSSSTVEQIGTDSDCAGGRPVYYAWYEFYPQPSYYAGGLTNLKPGDVMTATVSFASNQFTATIKDTTSGLSYMANFTPTTAASRTSVEWIAEAPSSGNRILSLADFGTVHFTNSDATLEATSNKSVTSGPIGSFLESQTTNVGNSANVQVSTMVSDGKKVVPMATPGALSGSDSSGFPVKWDSAGP